MDYGRAIKMLRAAHSLSQSQLASLTGLNRAYISKIENGEKTPSLESFEAIAKALDTPMHLLMLLASKPSKTSAIKDDEANQLGFQLLSILTSSHEQPKTAI